MNPQSQEDSIVAPLTGQGDWDDDQRQQGEGIAQLSRIESIPIGYRVYSQSGNGSYIVSVQGIQFCSCPAFEKMKRPCKHIYAVKFLVEEGSETENAGSESQRARPSYSQDWKAYNAAQTNEQRLFVTLLGELCSFVRQPPKKLGRPRLPLQDVLLALGIKVYSTMSARRAMSNIRDVHVGGLMSECPIIY